MLIPCLMPFGIVDHFQIIDIHHDNRKLRRAVFLDQHVQMLLFVQISMSVFDTGERIDICFFLRLFQTSCKILFLTHMRINIIHPDDQTAPFLLFHHRGFQTHMLWSSLHYQTVSQNEDPALCNHGKHIVLCKKCKKALQIIRIDHTADLISGIGKKIRPDLAEVIGFELFSRTEFPIVTV